MTGGTDGPPPLDHPTRAVYWEPPKPLATGADAKIPHERAPTWANRDDVGRQG